MTSFIYIEPAHEHRPAFAAWGLAQERPLQTATATGWDVPVDLYPSVPVELLEGAYVDGYPYGRGRPQPVKQDRAAPRKPRKRAAKKATAKPPVLTVSVDDTDAVIEPLVTTSGEASE